MKVFVINLKDSYERRHCADKQLKESGIDYYFFDAVNGCDGHEKFFRGYDERSYLINTGRLATPGEIGCYASHIFLWKECVARNQPMVIMEDDFVLSADFADALAEAEHLIGRYKFIRLQQEKRGRKKKIMDAGRFSLHRYTKMPHSLLCYAIHPDVAKAFIEGSQTLKAPVDVFVKKIWEHKQLLYGLMPYTVDNGPHGETTTIGGRVKAKRGFEIRFIRFLTKIDWIIRGFLFNLKK